MRPACRAVSVRAGIVRGMQWWNDLVDWLSSDDGWRVLTAAVFPFVAIIVAGIVAALIGRSAAKRVLAFQDRELKASAIATLIGVGRKAASWSSLSTPEQQHYDTLISEADARMRLLPVSGSTVVADWSAHQIAEMKKNSAIFSFQAEQTLEEFRDRLIEWQHKPARARKLLKYDLEQWKFQKPSAEQELSLKQQEWAHQQTGTGAAATSTAAAPATAAVAAPAGAPATSAPAAPTHTAAPPSTEATPTAAAPAVAPAPTSDTATSSADATSSPVTGQHRAVGTTDGFAPPMAANSVRERITPTDD